MPSVSGRMLSGTLHDPTTLDKAVVIALQFAPDIINTVQVLQPQQVVLEVRFVEASRQLGVQRNSFGKNTLNNRARRFNPTNCPSPPGGRFQQPQYALPPATSAARTPWSPANKRY